MTVADARQGGASRDDGHRAFGAGVRAGMTVAALVEARRKASRSLAERAYERLVREITRLNPDPGSAPDRGHDHHHHGHAHAPAESFVMDASGEFSREGLAEAFASMPGNVWRSKGFLTVDGEPSLLQFTMGQLEIDGAPPWERPYLVMIGQDLDRRAVESRVLAARREAPGPP